MLTWDAAPPPALNGRCADHGANRGIRTHSLVLTKDAHILMCFEGLVLPLRVELRFPAFQTGTLTPSVKEAWRKQQDSNLYGLAALSAFQAPYHSYECFHGGLVGIRTLTTALQVRRAPVKH